MFTKDLLVVRPQKHNIVWNTHAVFIVPLDLLVYRIEFLVSTESMRQRWPNSHKVHTCGIVVTSDVLNVFIRIPR